MFAAFLSNYLLASWTGGVEQGWWWGYATWRWMFWVEILPALLFLGAIELIPESPRYLLAAQSPRETESVRTRPLVVGIGLSAFQQLVGINVIFYYGAVLWQSAGLSEGEALTTNVVSGTVNVVFTFLAMALIDRVGRKPLLAAGSAGMTLTLGALAAIFTASDLGSGGSLTSAQAIASLVAVHIYIACFASSWGPVVWVMLGELFDNHVRGTGMGLSAAAQWFTNFAVTVTFPVLLGSLGLSAAYIVYCVAAFFSFVFVLRAVVETRGLSLEQSAELFG